MPAAAPAITSDVALQLRELGRALAGMRKQQKIAAGITAEAAGISRVTLHRIENGAANVAIASWAAVAAALGVKLGVVEPDRQVVREAEVPDQVRLAEYPQLQGLAWQLPGVEELEPREALQLYERNWRHVDKEKVSVKELLLIRALAERFGGGSLLV